MYKYLKRQYAEGLLNKNEIVIGTLYGYRDMEQTEENKGRYDPFEGKYKDKLSLINPNIPKDDWDNPIVRGNIGSFKFENCAFVNIHNEYVAPNCLIYCTSYEKSLEVMSEFKDADTCIEIKNISSFYNLITWELQRKLHQDIRLRTVSRIDYDFYERVRSDIYGLPLHPALAKTQEYKKQCEIRAIWSVPDNFQINEAFYKFSIVGLRKNCRLVEI